MMDALLLDALIAGAGLLGTLGIGTAIVMKRKKLPVFEPPPVTIRHEHIDEYLYLKDFVYVPYKPAQYVEPGTNPTAAARERTRKTGIRHYTRRVE